MIPWLSNLQKMYARNPLNGARRGSEESGHLCENHSEIKLIDWSSMIFVCEQPFSTTLFGVPFPFLTLQGRKRWYLTGPRALSKNCRLVGKEIGCVITGLFRMSIHFMIYLFRRSSRLWLVIPSPSLVFWFGIHTFSNMISYHMQECLRKYFH